ncbi:MAG: NUDIX hydrolase [Pseudomonadota bacterium]
MTNDSVRNLIEILRVYQIRYPDEVAAVERFIDFLTRNGEASFDRSLTEGHITASCWLLDSTQSHVLLTHHKKLGIWIQPGGHADGDDTPTRVALKEAHEESGLNNIELLFDGELFDVDWHRIPARKTEPEHIHYDLRYAMRSTGSDEYVVSDESHDLRWVAFTDLTRVTRDESVNRLNQKWLARSQS